MNYNYYAPTNFLRNFVKCLWSVEFDKGFKPGGCNNLFPTGCTELLFYYGRNNGDDSGVSSMVLSQKSLITGYRVQVIAE